MAGQTFTNHLIKCWYEDHQPELWLNFVPTYNKAEVFNQNAVNISKNVPFRRGPTLWQRRCRHMMQTIFNLFGINQLTTSFMEIGIVSRALLQLKITWVLDSFISFLFSEIWRDIIVGISKCQYKNNWSDFDSCCNKCTCKVSHKK